MTRERFIELTEELLETCKSELETSIGEYCYIARWNDLLNDIDYNAIDDLKEIAEAVNRLELYKDIEDDFDPKDAADDIITICGWIYAFPSDDEHDEYMAIVKGEKELEEDNDEELED